MLYATLPHSFKNATSNYITKLTNIISILLQRLQGVSSAAFRDFFTFLVRTLVVRNAYPATVHEKEDLLLLCMSAIIDTVALTIEGEAEWMTEMLCKACTFEPLLHMLFSKWDKGRTSAFNLLKKIFVLRKKQLKVASSSAVVDIPLPAALTSELYFKRAIHLASSPRQKESDSGAYLLRLLFVASDCDSKFLRRVVDIVIERVQNMEVALRGIATAKDGQDLPLAHGLLLAMKMCVDEGVGLREASGGGGSDEEKGESGVKELLRRDIVDICSKAIDLSLAVICDIKDNEGDPHGDDRALGGGSISANNITLNVNGGCLGANTSFGGLTMKEEEKSKRSGVQRIVVS